MDGKKIEKVVIFMGAGVAVPLGLPTTIEFMAGIKEGQKTVTERVCAHLGAGSSKSSRGEDIEWILGELERFSSGVGFIEENFPYLANGNSNAMAGVAHMSAVISRWKLDAKQEITRIKKLLYKKLIKFDDAVASKLYLAIIKQLRARHASSSISVITTNYDLTFDTFIDDVDRGSVGIKNFDTSFKGNNYDNKETFEWNPETIEFLKIHGSLDWHINSRKCAKVGVATVPDEPDDLPILYPGFKGAPKKEPFISLHGKVTRRLNQADHVYVLGFAFRDDYINGIFENALGLRPDLKVYHINPSKMEDYPEESSVPKFKKMFTNFEIVQKGVEVSDSPIHF